jgi:hypothetical protein
MSYARFSASSDVYVFMSVGGWLECCGCLLEDEWVFTDTASMIEHLAEHRAAGHSVPDIEDELRADDAENFPKGEFEKNIATKEHQ